MKRWLSFIWVLALSVGLAHAAIDGAAEADTWGAKTQKFMRSAQVLGQRVSRSLGHGWKIVRKKSDAITEKLIGKMNKPLDRSAANKKAAMLNNSLEEANRAAAAATEKAKNANREIYKMRNEGFGSYTSSSGSKDTKSDGRFTSLD